jgi:hypothetical protein
VFNLILGEDKNAKVLMEEQNRPNEDQASQIVLIKVSTIINTIK